MRPKKLKRNLLLIPSLVILISFGIILATFNVVIYRYIEKTTTQQMAQKMEIFDVYFTNDAEDKSELPEDENLIIPVHYIILDPQDRMLFPTPPWLFEQEKIRTEAIIRHFLEHRKDINEETASIVNTETSTYYVKAKQYMGEYDGYLITQEGEDIKPHTILIYANISPIQDFLNLLNNILLFLMIGFGAISILIIFGMAKKIDHSLGKLKKYIIRVGNRESLTELDNLPYEEFNEVTSTVREMSKMIDRAEESQKQFFQNASHELRTPLMSIQGYAEGIQSGVMKDREKAMAVILKESEKMSDLVDEILFLSKMDIAGIQSEPEILDLKEVIYDCSWRIKGAADQKNLRIEHQLPESAVLMYGGEKLMERALINLLSNAVRYAKTKIQIICQTEHSRIRIRILDDGDGISEKDLPHIFERFYKGAGGNFGIGLSVTDEIIRQHGGTISVRSTVGQTEFILDLPKYQASEKDKQRL